MSDAASLPQRILMTTDTVSATWQYAMQLGTEFTRRGIETALATLGELPSAQQRSEAERAGVQLYVSRHKLEWMDDFWVDDERAGDWLLGLEDEFKPDLVHLNGYVHGALPWRAPHVVVAHDCVLSRWEALYGTAPPPTLARYQSAVRLALQRSRFVVAPSRTMLAALTRHYGPLPGARVIHHGRGPAPYRELAKQPFAFTVGRVWDAGKNLDSVAAAARNITWPIYCAGPARHPQGEDRHMPGLRSLGRLETSELARWYGAASLFLAPARYEPFGLAPVEAALSGCALILGDIASQRELWEGAALFVDPHDPQALAAAANGLIANPKRRSVMMALARQRAPRYSVRAMVAAYLQLYRSMLVEEEKPAAVAYTVEQRLYAV